MVCVESVLMSAWIPSLIGMLVLRDVTSVVTKMVCCGSGVSICWMVLRKCAVSLMYEGMSVTRGLRQWSMYLERLPVRQSQPEMIGQPGMSGLVSLGRR